MKKLLFTLITCCMGALSAAAQENVTIDGINYYLYNYEATVAVQSKTLDGSIVIPDELFYNSVTYKVTGIANDAFAETQIIGIELPEGITTLGNRCFQRCGSLYYVKIKGDVTSLGEACFESCGALTSLDFLPQTVTSLGPLCFSGCDLLTTIKLPNNITTLGNYCFQNCDGLQMLFYQQA